MNFDFIGGAYEAANPLQDDQALVGWYVETDRNPQAKSPVALLGCPGLSEAVTSTFTGEVRGGHVLPGGSVAYFVIGGQVAKMTISAQASVSAKATFALTAIGTVNTTSGPVCMRDNGVAGILAIVDGQYMYVVNTRTDVVTTVSDPNVINPDRLASVDGWLVFNSRGTQKFNTTPSYWNGTTALDGTYFALKDNAPDNLVTLIEDKRELWLVGEKTTEVWFNAGGATFPFGRLQGAMLQVGCAAKHTIVRTGHGVCWLGASERGENYVVMTAGYEFKNISNPALAYAITQYNVISDAFAYVYTEEGHEFYVLVFPTADATWVYDLTTDMWHQRQSYGTDGKLHRSRANCLINFAGQRIVGDNATGQLWQQSRTFFTDGDRPLYAMRRTPYVWDGADRNRVRHSRLQLEFKPGVGLTTGQGSDPQVMLRWRDENGWSNRYTASIGKIGEARNRAIFRKLGAARNRVYEVSITDPVSRDVVGASIRAGGTGA